MNYDLYSLAKDLAPILLGLGAYLSGKLLDSWKSGTKRCNVSDDVSKNTTILSKLIEARLLADCDRVKLYQFYNGDHYVSGQSVVKCAVTHMSIRPGVAPNVINGSYDIPIAWLHDVIQPLLLKKSYHMKTEELPDSDWKSAKLANEEFASFYVRLGTANNMRGYLVIAWHDEDGIVSPEVEKEILTIADQLTGVLVSG